MLEFHRRENKAPWWEYFRLRDLSDEELLNERSALSGLEFVARIGGTVKCPIDRYRFPPQEADIRVKAELQTRAGKFGEVIHIDAVLGNLEVKKRTDTANVHPPSVFAHTIIPADKQAESLYRIGAWVADHGVDADGEYRAGRDLLLRKPPRLCGRFGTLILATDRASDSSVDHPGMGRDARPTNLFMVDEAKKLALDLDHGTLPVQGPPGAGKTFMGARMICELLRNNKKVGITAVSHKVIRKLVDEVDSAAREDGTVVHAIVKVSDDPAAPTASIVETKDNPAVLAALESGEANLAAGTAWLWSLEEHAEAVDVLFVDEAGQMSLPDVLAVSQAARSVVLLGDPQQLE